MAMVKEQRKLLTINTNTIKNRIKKGEDCVRCRVGYRRTTGKMLISSHQKRGQILAQLFMTSTSSREACSCNTKITAIRQKLNAKKHR